MHWTFGAHSCGSSVTSASCRIVPRLGGNHGVRHIRMFAWVLFPVGGCDPRCQSRDPPSRPSHTRWFRDQSWAPAQDERADGWEERTKSSMLSREATLATGQPAGSTAMRWSMFRPTRSAPTDHSSSSCRTCSTPPAIRDSISFRDHPQGRASSIRHCSAPSMALIERMAFVETWNSWNSSNGLVRLSCCRAACASSAESARTARPLRNAWFRNPPLRSAGSSHAPDSRIGALQCWYSGVFGVPNTAARRTRKPATAL